MKINSNTIKLEKESYEQLETIVKKIASENKIENVSDVQIKLSKDRGVVAFKSKIATGRDQLINGIKDMYDVLSFDEPRELSTYSDEALELADENKLFSWFAGLAKTINEIAFKYKVDGGSNLTPKEEQIINNLKETKFSTSYGVIQ